MAFVGWRFLRSSAMKVIDVRERGLVGRLFAADDERPRPAVLVLGGSEGGPPNDMAEPLADEGFTCLSLAYFDVRPLPCQLVEIPLEYIEIALAWMRAHRLVVGSSAGVLGASKGAELALLAAATFPDVIRAVVAYSPSAVVFEGIDRSRDAECRSSWTHRGEPLAFVPYPPDVRPAVSLRGVSFAPIYDQALDNLDAVAAAGIPIERTHAPILLISGDKDRMWPASQMADMLKARLASINRANQIVHLRYPEAGHVTPWSPSLRMRLGSWLYDLGGHRRDNRDALGDAWPRTVMFLKEHLNWSHQPCR